MLTLVNIRNQAPTNCYYICTLFKQFQILTARFKKIYPRLTHIFKINNPTNYQVKTWILDYRSVQLVIIDLNILITVKDNLYVLIIVKNKILDHYQLIELVRNSIMLINKYTPRMDFSLKRYLVIITLTCNESIKMKNGMSQGYFFLRRDLVI
jgi:hypothetical protein